jgi:glutamate dehydrogenase
MTDEVAAHVLRHNYDQSAALGNSRAQSRPLLPVHRRMITILERAGRLDRALEALPADDELEVRAQSGLGLTSPEFAVLLAYTKMVLKLEIGESELPTRSGHTPCSRPTSRRRCGSGTPTGWPPIRCAATSSPPCSPTTWSTTAASASSSGPWRRPARRRSTCCGRTWWRAEATGLGDLWRGIDALDTKVPTTVQTTVHLEVRRLLDRAVRWLVSNRRSPIDVSGEIARLRPA